MTEAEWLEPPQDEVVGTCAECQGEIYKGETCYRINGELIHEDCGWSWFSRTYRKYLEVIE